MRSFSNRSLLLVKTTLGLARRAAPSSLPSADVIKREFIAAAFAQRSLSTATGVGLKRAENRRTKQSLLGATRLLNSAATPQDDTQLLDAYSHAITSVVVRPRFSLRVPCMTFCSANLASEFFSHFDQQSITASLAGIRRSRRRFHRGDFGAGRERRLGRLLCSRRVSPLKCA